MASSGSLSTPTTALLCPTVVGRDRELTALVSALASARRGEGRASFLVGEAGIGKSRLAREAAAAADRVGMLVLRGRAVESASPAPYRPLAEALCAAVRTTGPPEHPDLVPFRAALGRLVPEWRDEDAIDVDESGVVLGEAVLRFLRVVAVDRGCLLVLEDLHWADPETLVIAEYLVDNLATEPVLLLATVRPEPDRPGLALIRRLEARRAGVVFALARLDDDEVGQMVAACVGAAEPTPELVALAARAEGIPFLVEELLASSAAAGALVRDGGEWTIADSVEPVVPLTFADTLRRRLDPLGARTRLVLTAAAVLGRRFDWALLPSITESTKEMVIEALRRGVDAQIVAVDPTAGSFLFRHALTRDVVLADLLPPERADLARRALAAVEDQHPDLPGPWCELAAELALAAGERERAARLLLEVGRRAFASGALASAELALDRARGYGGATAAEAIDELLVEVLSLSGKRDRAFEVSASLLARLGRGRDDATRRADVHLLLARAAVAATDWDVARDQLAAARAEVAASDDESLGPRIDSLEAHAAMGEHRPEQAVGLARAAITGAERVGLPDVRCEALEIVGRCARPRDLEEAERAFAGAYRIADECGLAVWRVRALHELGTIDLLRNADDARLHQARDLAASVGALATTAVIDVQIAAALTVRARPEAMLRYARRGAELARRYGLELTFAAARGFEGHAHAYLLERTEMDECFADALAHSHGDPGIAVIVRTGAAYAALANEDRAVALHDLAAAAELSWRSPGDQTTGPSAGMWALVRAVTEPDREAALPEAPGWWEPVHVLSRGWLGYAEAVVLGRRGRGREAETLVGATDAELQEFDWYRMFGHRLMAEAALTDGWGDPVTWLREALAFFETWGYERVTSACRSLLRRAGVPVPRRDPDAASVPPALRVLGVTARELEVLDLLGEGLSNREIGEYLFLSPRTVERHVANLCVKTGVERRTQLVAFAARARAGSG